MADFEVELLTSEINVTLVLEKTVGGEGSGVSTWEELEGKPSTFPPSTHNHDDLYFTEAEVATALGAKSDVGHNHNDLYFTEAEVATALGAKSDVGHNHNDLYFTEAETTALITARGNYARPFRVQPNEWFLSSQNVGTGYSATGVSSTAANSNGRAKITPFYIAEPTTIDALALHCVAANPGVGAVIRLGIYADNNGRPGDVIVDAGTASINTATLKTLTFAPIVLQPGFYWAVGATQNLDTAAGNPTFSSVTGGQTIGIGTVPASNNMFPIATVTLAGALTANPSLSVAASTSGAVFHIWIRRSA
jgi:hypothetical protein